MNGDDWPIAFGKSPGAQIQLFDKVRDGVPDTVVTPGYFENG
jgi:hypothetical protein